MPIYITTAFLKKIQQDGRLLEALERLDTLDENERAALPRLSGLSSWECILEEVLDTDHEPPYYDRFVHELLCRGYSKGAIKEMRMVAWETAGWLNYEQLLWDWCGLNEKDMRLGLENRFKSGNITQERFEQLATAIERYRDMPSRTGG